MSKIALIGLDGSGKSTVISKLKLLDQFSHYSFAWCRWEPKLLRPIYNILNKKINYKNSSNSLEYEYKKKNDLKKRLFKSKLVKKLWIKVAFFDYKMSFKKIKSKENNNMIFDRYYYDFFVDQCLNLNYSKEEILNEIKKYESHFWKLDKVIYIKVSPQTCYSRKNDIPSINYLEKRYSIYNYLAEELNWIIVSGEISFNDELGLIINQVVGG